MGDISEHFSRSEFSCLCGCGFATADIELIEVLEDLRNYFDSSVMINSGCRCISHNHSVGGSSKSKHTQGIAVDLRVKDVPSDEVFAYLVNRYPDKYGIGRYNGRTHIDVRLSKARWQG